MATHTANDDFAILQVLEAEASEEYAAGFYLFEEAIMQIEEELRLAHA